MSSQWRSRPCNTLMSGGGPQGNGRPVNSGESGGRVNDQKSRKVYRVCPTLLRCRSAGATLNKNQLPDVPLCSQKLVKNGTSASHFTHLIPCRERSWDFTLKRNLFAVRNCRRGNSWHTDARKNQIHVVTCKRRKFYMQSGANPDPDPSVLSFGSIDRQQESVCRGWTLSIISLPSSAFFSSINPFGFVMHWTPRASLIYDKGQNGNVDIKLPQLLLRATGATLPEYARFCNHMPEFMPSQNRPNICPRNLTSMQQKCRIVNCATQIWISSKLSHFEMPIFVTIESTISLLPSAAHRLKLEAQNLPSSFILSCKLDPAECGNELLMSKLLASHWDCYFAPVTSKLQIFPTNPDLWRRAVGENIFCWHGHVIWHLRSSTNLKKCTMS